MIQTIKVLVKEPYKEIEVREIQNNLKSLQAVVGGYIECVPFPRVKDVDLIVNEEGKLARLDGNFFLPHYKDCVVGTAIIASYNKEGQFVSLTDEHIKKVKEYINSYKLEKGQNLYDNYDILSRLAQKKMNELNEQM